MARRARELQDEYKCQWLELQPAPDAKAIENFRERFPATPVTTTQPGSWDKIEIGMTRGMVRTLVGGRLLENDRNRATLRQDPQPYERVTIRLYFAGASTEPSSDDDPLAEILVQRAVNRPIRSTDWP